MHVNRSGYFRLQKVYLEVSMIKEYPFCSLPPTHLGKPQFLCYSSLLKQCAGSGLPHPSGLPSLFLCLFYTQAVFLCLLVLLPLFQAWQTEGVEFRLVRASPLFFSAVNMCLLVLLDILRRLPDDMHGNTDEVNGTSGEILKIPIYIGTSGNSYFQNLFCSAGESWKLLKIHRMCLYNAGSTLSFTALSLPRGKYLVLCTQRHSWFWTERVWTWSGMANLFISVVFLSLSISPALLGLVALSFPFS